MRPRIVILDGFTLNPGDLEWSAVSALGEVAVYDRTPPELVGVRAAGAEVVLTNKTVLSAEVIEGLPELRYIGVWPLDTMWWTWWRPGGGGLWSRMFLVMARRRWRNM